MSDRIKLLCDSCGQLAETEVNSYVGPDGKRIEWPKAEIKDGQMCFTIICPTCGERQKCLATNS
jgi:hypothetical protein